MDFSYNNGLILARQNDEKLLLLLKIMENDSGVGSETAVAVTGRLSRTNTNTY